MSIINKKKLTIILAVVAALVIGAIVITNIQKTNTRIQRLVGEFTSLSSLKSGYAGTYERLYFPQFKDKASFEKKLNEAIAAMSLDSAETWETNLEILARLSSRLESLGYLKEGTRDLIADGIRAMVNDGLASSDPAVISAAIPVMKKALGHAEGLTYYSADDLLSNSAVTKAANALSSAIIENDDFTAYIAYLSLLETLSNNMGISPNSLFDADACIKFLENHTTPIIFKNRMGGFYDDLTNHTKIDASKSKKTRTYVYGDLWFLFSSSRAVDQDKGFADVSELFFTFPETEVFYKDQLVISGRKSNSQLIFGFLTGASTRIAQNTDAPVSGGNILPCYPLAAYAHDEGLIVISSVEGKVYLTTNNADIYVGGEPEWWAEKYNTASASVQAKRLAEGEAKLKAGDYDAAISIFASLGNYEGAAAALLRATTARDEHRDAEAAKIAEQIKGGARKVSLGGYSWIVVDAYDAESGTALLLMEDIMLADTYHSTKSVVSWEASRLYSALNSDLYGSFSPGEKAMIIDTKAAGSSSSPIVLLTSEQAKKYFGNDTSRVANYNGEAAKWWLLGEKPTSVTAVVDTDGSIIPASKTAVNSLMGVRPAIWLNIG